MSIYEVGASVPPVCPSCGTDTNLARRCGACGRVFIPDEVNPEPAKNKSRYLAVGGIVAALAAGSFALWHAASPALHSSSLVVPSAQSQPVPPPIDVPATDQPPRKSVSAAHATTHGTTKANHNRKRAKKRTKKR